METSAAEWPQFEWQKKHNQPWTPYRPEHQAQLRQAWESGERTVMLNVDGWEYGVDLTPGQQQQLARATGFVGRCVCVSDRKDLLPAHRHLSQTLRVNERRQCVRSIVSIFFMGKRPDKTRHLRQRH